MAISASVVYPQGISFDMEYYLSTHMPLVQARWGQYGLKSWKIVKYDDKAPYQVQALLEWETEEGISKAFGSEAGKEVMADVANFTNGKPEIMKGQVQAEMQVN